LALTGDARVTLEELLSLLMGHQTDEAYQHQARQYNKEWDAEVQRLYDLRNTPLMSQSEVVGIVNTMSQPRDVVLCAAGSLPGDLHKLWRTREARGYHMEYGFSCMGYEIAGGLGVKMADPSRNVYVMVGDGSFLMMSSEIVTMVQEKLKVIIVLLDNHGYASIGGLSKSVGSDGFGTKYRYREDDRLIGETLPIDFALSCSSMGAHTISVHTHDEFVAAMKEAQHVEDQPVCIVVEVDRTVRVGGYESWWDVPVAEVSTNPDVQTARTDYETAQKKQQTYL
jgi:3D-(3,5/4)-trihydroxycyclohexane-1,2-dione acylhydrolase (decyclizing)